MFSNAVGSGAASDQHSRAEPALVGPTTTKNGSSPPLILQYAMLVNEADGLTAQPRKNHPYPWQLVAHATCPHGS